MANEDKKITELSPDASPTMDDLLVLLNDPGGTPGEKKVTLENLKDAIFRDALSPIAISPSAFMPEHNGYDWSITWLRVKNNSTLNPQSFYAPINFPNGVTVTKLTLYGYRDDGSATMTLTLVRNDRENAVSTLASITADWTSGYSSKEHTTIDNSVIDNENYNYALKVSLNPNDSTDDIWLTGVEIEF